MEEQGAWIIEEKWQWIKEMVNGAIYDKEEDEYKKKEDRF